MNKKIVLALVLTLALLVNTGCSLIVKDEAVDRATPIIEVAGQVITKGEVKDQIGYMLDSYEGYYAQYGMPFDKTDAENIAMAQEDVINGLIQGAVQQAKVAELGLDALTSDEELVITSSAEADHKLYFDLIQSYFFADTELTGDALTAAVEKQMMDLGYPTQEELVENERMNLWQKKLREAVVGDVTVSDDEIAAEYDSRVAGAKAAYEANADAFIEDSNMGDPAYYTPAGLRYVKHILVKFNEADQTAITDLQTALDTLTDEAEIAAKQAEIDAATEAAFAAVMPTITEIQEKLAAGESFDSLITAYNQDPGMSADSVGYAVNATTTAWVPEFRDAAMALANVGDVSQPVRSSYGIHLIQYTADIPEGAAAFETVRDTIADELLTEKQDNTYTETLNKWVQEANAKVDMKALQK